MDHDELTKVEGGWLTPDRRILVTQEDIDHGLARNQYNCAIVRAIQRKYPEAVRVRVNAKLIGFSIGEERFTYPTPPEAVESIIKPFDQGGKPEAGWITLKAGKVKDVEHSDERTLAQSRVYNRAWRTEQRRKGISARQEQMSPNYTEFERF